MEHDSERCFGPHRHRGPKFRKNSLFARRVIFELPLILNDVSGPNSSIEIRGAPKIIRCSKREFFQNSPFETYNTNT